MKFNRKIQLKTLKLILVLTIVLTLSIAITVKPNRKIPILNPQEVKIKASSPVTPQYKYQYENDFDYYNFSYSSVFYIEAVGYDTEWSQDQNDGLGLHLYYWNVFNGLWSQFFMSGSLFVVSRNTFEFQNNSGLGGYVDFHVDVDMTETDIFCESVDIILAIFRMGDPPLHELINVYNLTHPQKGRFYLPNFEQYIWPDGKIRFGLGASANGIVTAGSGVVSLLLSFEGLRVIQELVPKEEVIEKKTLILAHGYSFLQEPETPSKWATYIFTQEFLETYDDIIVLNYVSWFYAYRYSKDAYGIWHDYVLIPSYEQVTNQDSIDRISGLLAQYMINDSAQIEDRVDFICHSMGGLVTRHMIKNYYHAVLDKFKSLNRTFKIEHVAMMATPNHGAFSSVGGDQQQLEMMPDSDFLNRLNAYDGGPNPYSEIPFIGLNTTWFTYRSGLYRNIDGFRHDGIVGVNSVPLNGAKNKGWYQQDHNDIRHNEMMRRVIFNDLNKPPAIIKEIFEEDTPGIIMGIENLTLQPNYEEPGGKTLLSITLPAEDQGDITPSTVTLNIDSNTYQMIFNSGTYEVELPLVDGDYSFLITADLTTQDGRLYQMSGILTIVDDDGQPPEIQITPGDTVISDEAAVGGILVEWEISDYSSISEATVKLNGVEISSYINQGTIIDSYLLTNDPGIYTISVWAQDNDNDPNHDPPGVDRSEDSSESTITIYDDDSSIPNIYSTPEGDLSISDEEAVGGVLVSWEISDESDISEARVEINGNEIYSYTDVASISDSYLIPNEVGVYELFIWAKDGDNDSEDDWLEHSINWIITIYDDDLDPPEIEITPGDLALSVEEAEGGVSVVWEISDDSGISEANVFLNGIQIRSYENYGTIIDGYLLTNQPGVYNFAIWAKDNDNDLEADWLDYSTQITITIYEDEEEPPPPEIPGYNIFILLGILSIVVFVIINKKRNPKF